MSTPCTEGTGSFCRVPSRGFSRTPSDARLAHLCRIAVRAAVSSTRGFSRPALRRTSGSNAVALAGRGRLSPRSVCCRRPSRFDLRRGWRNINRVPIGCALGPRLRSRLTLGGLTFPRKPCAFGGWASHPSCRYSFRHTHSPTLHRSSPSGFAAEGDALLRLGQVRIRDCGATLESPSFSARDGSTGKLLRTFEMMAASKPTSRLSPRSHFLCH